MPICPGCEQSVPYDRLDVHQRYCSDIWGESRTGNPSIERIEHRLADLERRVDGRLREVEADFERRLHRLEQARRTRGRPSSE